MVMKQYQIDDDLDPLKYANGDKKAESKLRKIFVGAIFVDPKPDPRNPMISKY